MKRLSIKVRITVWYTMLLTIMASLLLVFMLSIRNTVVIQTAMEQISQTVRSNLGEVSIVEGKLQLGNAFSFHQNGVYTLIYSKSEALLAGQVPLTFTSAVEPFRNGLTRPVEVQGYRYYVMDLWLPLDWEIGVWVRGLMEAPEAEQSTGNLLRVTVVALPVFLLLAGLGGYWIAKRAFRPLDSITAAAAAINEARDLSGRIALPPGKDEFSRLGYTFDQMFERLEKSFEAEKQFTADASHELRTPVSVIKGACEYAEKFDETEEERRETIEMIHRQADKMSAIISQLLSMTRLDQGSETIRLGEVDLAGLAREVCRDPVFDASHLTLEMEDGVNVRADRGLMSRLIRNLVENAFKYGKPGGQVWVSVAQEGEKAILRVRDDGVGIARDQQEKIWQRFYQVDPARSGGSGAGLGLAMVLQIARAHGGQMEVESVPGLGSAFTLYLPLNSISI